MKRITLIILAVATLLLCLACLTSCSEPFDAPKNLKLDVDTQTLKWNKVDKARMYEVIISGEDRVRTTRANYYSLEYLEPGVYDIQVRAVGYDADNCSEWVT